MILSNQELYLKVKCLSEEIRLLNDVEIANMLVLAMSASSMPSEILGEIRIAALAVLSDKKLASNKNINELAKEIIDYVNIAFKQ